MQERNEKRKAVIKVGIFAVAVIAAVFVVFAVTRAQGTISPTSGNNSLLVVTSAQAVASTDLLAGNTTTSVEVGLISQDGANTNDVSVQVQLLQNGTVVQSATYNNQNILHEYPQTYWLSLTNVPAGTYTVGAAVYNADGSLNAMFNNLGSITVGGTSVTTPTPTPTPTSSSTPTPTPTPTTSATPTPTPTPTATPTSTTSTAASVTILPSSLPDAIVGSSYAQTLTASTTATGTFNWSVASGSLPGGLMLNNAISSTTASITGTPSSTGSSTFAIMATNGTNSSTQSYMLSIDASSSAATSTPTGGATSTVPSSVQVTSVYGLGSSLPSSDTQTTITPYLISENGGNTNNVTVNVDLTQNGTTTAQAIYGNQTILHEYPQAFPLTTPSNLPAGTYTLAVTVYNADGSVNASFPNLGTIVVNP